VPPEYVESILQGVVKVNPLLYGKYSKVAYQSEEGIEQFVPLEGSNATKGEINKLYKGKSVRIEFSIDKNDKILEKVIQEGIMKNHPWEEPVIIISEVWETRKK
jgi:hypothetical protein